GAWARAAPEQRKQLVEEFRRMLVRTYANAISADEGQTMQVLPVRMKPGDTEVTVHNRYIRAGSKPLPARMYRLWTVTSVSPGFMRTGSTCIVWPSSAEMALA